MKATVEIEKIIGYYDNEKTILRFLICCEYYHSDICKKNYCKFDYLLDVLNGICISSLPPKEKVSEFQRYCRFHYKEFIGLHYYLKSLAAIIKENEKKEKEFKNKFINQKMQKKCIFFY